MARRLLVSGRVQGVGYRQWVCREAERRGIAGWVRNLRDGRVEALLDGADVVLDAFVEAAREGPPAARVESLRVEPAEGTFSGFEVRPTV
jgi:acylphosphatase